MIRLNLKTSALGKKLYNVYSANTEKNSITYIDKKLQYNYEPKQNLL